MNSSLRHTFRKYSSSRHRFNVLPLSVAKRAVFSGILILFVRWSMRKQLFCAKGKPGKFSDIVVGVLTTPEYFSSRFGFQLSTFLSDILDNDGNLVVSLERGAVSFKQLTQQVRFPNHPANQFTIFESKCPVGYSQLICRTTELLRSMVDAHPNVSWYIRIDDDTLLIPQALHILLGQLDPQDSLGLGSPSFYFCTSLSSCTHKRYPGLPWKNIDQVVRLIRGGAGYVLSSSVISWIISNDDQISATAKHLKSDAEDLTIFYALQKRMERFEIIQARSFFFERPELALRFDPFQDKSDVKTPVSFHMNHNLVNGYSVYNALKDMHPIENGPADADNRVLKDVASSQSFGKIRWKVASKLNRCIRGATNTKLQSGNWDFQLRDRLVDLVLALLVSRFNEDRDYESLLWILDEMVGAIRIFYVPGTKENGGGDIMLRKGTFSAPLVSFPKSMESRESREITMVNSTKARDIRMLWRSEDQQQKLRLVRMSYASTIDLLVDCERDEKRVRHKINAHRERRKNLREWSALQAVRGYARSRMQGNGYFWQMHYLQYISHLRDSWKSEGECKWTLDCQHTAVELFDVILYLRRGRVVLTERREHHLILAVLQIAHVYIHDEADVKSRAKSLCDGELPFVKCVSNLLDATEALSQLLLGESFFNRTWRVPALIQTR